MRKQYGIKFEPDFIAQVDLMARELGMTRTDLFEKAVERFMASPSDRIELEMQSSAARPGARVAYVCEKCEPRARVFGKAGEVPRCEKHGAMSIQQNRPYRGRRA